MSLPPEQINIKRRREEEPVETLYIQSELPQKKRRFTDFIFQRVRVGSEDDRAATLGPSTAAQNLLRSPRSVSTSVFPGNRDAGITTGGGIPSVRATSPGAEFRNERKLAAAQRKAAEERKRALESTPGHLLPVTKSGEKPDVANSLTDLSPSPSLSSSSRSAAVGASPSFPTSLRRFHISRPSTPSNILKAGGGGIQKRRDGAPARAVLVEKLTRAPTLRGASALETLERQRQQTDGAAELDIRLQTRVVEEAVIRKRPVVNQAEKRWREQQKASISAAKAHLSNYQTPGDLDRLAEELEVVMLNMDRDENDMDISSEPGQENAQLPTIPPEPISPTRTSSKYRPRFSNTPSARKAAVVANPLAEPSSIQPVRSDTAKEQEETAGREIDGDSDGEYVYDTYVRLPLRPAAHDGANIVDTAKTTLPTTHDHIDPSRKDIGVVVISKDDEEIWEEFAEDDADDVDPWDADDVDSNAEDHPANDYPEEESSGAEEEDDPTAVYNRYRRAGSDDEQWDIDDYDDHEEYLYRRHREVRNDSDDDDDMVLV